jgi:hypothetical protein
MSYITRLRRDRLFVCSYMRAEYKFGKKKKKKDETGHMTVIPTTRIPRRLVLTSNSYLFDSSVGCNLYTFMVDVLLVPLSFNMETCFDLYLAPFTSDTASWYMGTRSPRNNIILLRRIAFHGNHMTMKVKQWDVPEDIRNATDYRLVVTCPALITFSFTNFRVLLQLEMEF